MRRIIIAMFFVTIFVGVSQANILKALGVAMSKDLSLLKVSAAENADAMFKVTQDALAKIDMRIGKIETNLSASATIGDVEAKIAAYDNSKKVSNTVGGNQDNSSVVNNDPVLLKYIIGILGSICIWLIRSNMTKDKQITDLIARNSAKELKIFEMTDAHTRTLISMINAELVSDNQKGDQHIG